MKKTAKIISTVLCIVMLLALSVPAFATVYSDDYVEPVVNVIKGTEKSYNSYGTEIKYEFIISKENGDFPGVVRIDGKDLSVKDFKETKDSYVYTNSFILRRSTNVKFQVICGIEEFKETYTFKLDATAPTVKVTANGNNRIDIIAYDNFGLASIDVNGKVLANEKELTSKLTYATPYFVFADGRYLITATDLAGNKTLAVATYADGKFDISETQNVSNLTYFMNSNLFNENPLLYYYLMQNNTTADNNQYWYYYQLQQLQNSGDNSLLYWLLMNNPTEEKKTESTDDKKDEAVVLDNTNIMLYYLLNNDSLSDKNSQILYYILANGNQLDNNYIWYYLLSDSNEDIDPTLFYYLISGGNAAIPTATSGSSYLAYQYYYGEALGYVNGSSITTFTKDGKMTMTAPEVRDSKYVNYQWQKAVNGKWTNVGTNSSTLSVTPVANEKYRVILSSDFYYRNKTSDTLTVTAAMLEDTKEEETKDDEDKKEDEKVFSADDIKISGIGALNTIRVKVGQKFPLIANKIGYWLFDTTMFKGTNNSTTILEATKAGYTYLAYVGFDSKGNSAIKYILVQIVE